MTEAAVPLKQVGRYTIFDQIGSGGMATVHLARFVGPAGFSRVVAIKHLLPQLSLDAEFKALIVEEARMASRVRHPNVVSTLDVVVEAGAVYIVMEYVPGEALGFLRRAVKEARQDIPAAICSAIMVGVLQGLHAAHEARAPSGQRLDLVHRDVSPPNILVGSDGVPVVLDFGIARTLHGQTETRSGRVKGKSSYMAPEQIRGEPVTRAVDIFAATVVLWELLTGRRLFFGSTEQERMRKVLEGAEAVPPSLLVPRLPKGLDDVVLRGLRQNPHHRYKTALEMAEAIEKVVPPASQRAVAKWVAQAAGESLRERGELLRQVEIADLAIPTQPFDVGRSDGASQASYAPIAPTPRPPARRRLRLALVEGIAVGLVTAMMIGTLIRYGRPGERVPSQLSPTTSPAAAPVDTAPVVVPTRTAPSTHQLSAGGPAPTLGEPQPLDRPAGAIAPGILVAPIPPFLAGAPVTVPIVVSVPTPLVTTAHPTPPASPSPATSTEPHPIAAKVVARDAPQRAPAHPPGRGGIRGSKAPARPHPVRGTKRPPPRANPTAIAASAASVRGPTRARSRSEVRSPSLLDQ